MLNKIRKNSVLYKFLISYVLILIIALVPSFVLYKQTTEKIISEYKDASQALHRQTGKIIDSYMDSMNSLCLQLVNNPILNNFSMLREPLSGSKRYKLVQLQSQFKTYISLNNVASDFYIFFDNIQSALSPNGLYRKEHIFDKYHNGWSVDERDWYVLLRQYHNNTIYVMDKINDSENSVIMLSSIPSSEVFTPRAYMVLFFSDDIFAQLFKDIGYDEDMILFIMDDNDRIISSNIDIELPSNIKFEDFIGRSGANERTLNSEKYLLIHEYSTVTDWKFVTMIPYKSISKKTQNIRANMLIVFIAVTVIGVSTSIIFASRSYRPIGNLVSKFSPYFEASSSDAYMQIENAFFDILEDRRRINDLWMKQKESLQRDFFHALLVGKVKDSEQVRRVMSSFDVNFISDLFVIIVLQIRGKANAEYSNHIEHISSLFENEIFSCDIEDVYIYPIPIEDRYIYITKTSHINN